MNNRWAGVAGGYRIQN